MTTREDIIAAAKEADLYLYPQWLHGAKIRNAERFYAVAFEAGRQAELEECAQILERQDVDPAFKHRMANAIRARNTK